MGHLQATALLVLQANRSYRMELLPPPEGLFLVMPRLPFNRSKGRARQVPKTS
jgi:hypothetical protein